MREQTSEWATAKVTPWDLSSYRYCECSKCRKANRKYMRNYYQDMVDEQREEKSC